MAFSSKRRQEGSSRNRPHCRRGAKRPAAARIEQQHVGDVVVAADQIQISSLANADRLDHLDAKAGADSCDALGSFGPVQLKECGVKRRDRRRKRGVIRIDGQQHFRGAGADPRAEARGLIERHMARTSVEDHKADHIGAGLERRIDRVFGLEAAYFDESAHKRARRSM